MRPIRILIADPLDLVADGLRLRLADAKDFHIVGHVRDGRLLFEHLPSLSPDLVLLDVSLPGMDGIDATRRLHKRHPGLRILAHSIRMEIEYVNSMLIEGASGYISKNAPVEELMTAMRKVMKGERYLDSSAAASVAGGYRYTDKHPDGEYIGLTEREREIIRLVAAELTNDEIGAHLHLSTETVKTHRKRLMTKLNVRSAAGLVKYAMDRCWI